MDKKTDGKSCAMLISAFLIVGTIGIFRRYIPLSSALLAFSRGIIGAASLCVFLLLRGKLRWERVGAKKLIGMVLTGAFLGINWILLFEAYNYTTVATATLCYYMEPTIVLLLSPLLFRERLTLRRIVCAAVALIGMVFVSGITESGGVQRSDLRGIALGLGAACFYSLMVITNKKTSDGVDAFQKTIVQLFSAAVVLIPYLLVTEDFSAIEWNGRTLILLAVVGVVYTGIVYALYFGSMDRLKAQTVSTLSYLDPVVALVVSAAVLDEPMTAAGVIGAVLILGSALISELEPASVREN